MRDKVQELVAIDGTLLPALPRMAWALWQNPANRAGKLPLEFSVWRQVPVEFSVTDGNASERALSEVDRAAGGRHRGCRLGKEPDGAVGRLVQQSKVLRTKRPPAECQLAGPPNLR